jgi:hypothetical protein
MQLEKELSMLGSLVTGDNGHIVEWFYDVRCPVALGVTVADSRLKSMSPRIERGEGIGGGSIKLKRS